MAKVKKKPTLSAAEKAQKKIQDDHIRAVRSIFRYTGFRRISGVSREITYEGQATDIDDLYIFENVVVILEYTATASVGDHLKKKKIFYDKVLADPAKFLIFLKQRFSKKADELDTGYPDAQTVFRIIYCSRYDFDKSHKSNVPGPYYLDYPAVRYFSSVANTVRRSARTELFAFLAIPPNEVGAGGKIKVSHQKEQYHGSILPEGHSHFPKGFKLISFYVDPDALLKTSYVLRREGWRDEVNLYQRMISKGKIDEIRNYLSEQGRVFINNVIVTLPNELKFQGNDGADVSPAAITMTQPVTFEMPHEPNKIGIIDGQHRIFAYFESGKDDGKIAKLRVQQNLLATGIVFPSSMKDSDKRKFEARLFLEINSTQTGAKTRLKQSINLVLDPFDPESIAARVIQKLAESGPLAGLIEQYFFDTDKLKTSSIVSYGLRPLVKTAGADSIFRQWSDPEKHKIAEGDEEKLEHYLDYCHEVINRVMIAVRKSVGAAKWSASRSVKGAILTTTYVNAFLIVLRILIENKKSLTQPSLDAGFAKFGTVNLTPYHSSQYRKMAVEIAAKCFAVKP